MTHRDFSDADFARILRGFGRRERDQTDDPLRRMRALERPGDVPGVLILNGVCEDVTDRAGEER